MEEILEKLCENSVSDGSNCPNTSQFSHYYKSGPTINDQQKRRETILRELKKKRESSFDKNRDLKKEKNGGDEDFMEWNNSHSTKKKKWYSKEYQNKLMFSEWLIEVPEDFENNWLCVPCPKGHRALLVTTKENTEVYTKYGCLQARFQSCLPSGSRGNFEGDTILDCVWNFACKQYYVLDVLQWAGRDLTECEAQFRFFWLKSKFDELPKSRTSNEHNKYPIEPLQYYDCTQLKDLARDLYEFRTASSSQQTTSPGVDGLLFYHKEYIYEAGFTPLVGWLKPYMLPEILSIPWINAEYLKEKPEGYTNLNDHIDESKKQKRNWWSVKRFNSNDKS